MKNLKRSAIALSILIALLCTGCGSAYDYELKVVAENCGGYSELKQVWIDVTTVKALCKNGQRVSTKD